MTEPPAPPIPITGPRSPSTRDRRPGIAGLDEAELAALMDDLGQPGYRARQVGDATWRSTAGSWDEVTTLGRPLRTALAERVRFDTLAETSIRAAEGGTTDKALHRLSDGRLVESVLMHYPRAADRRERNTLCLSSQAGCAVGCPFCATGELGFERDLEVAEIVDQARYAQRRLATLDRHLTNIVFMGMGEPLLNLDAVLGAAAALTDPARFGLGARHLTVSTSGVVPAIERLARLRPQWTLAISLHAARDPLRDLLVPLNRRWPVAEVVAAAGVYALATGRRVSYEYVMIDGINDTIADADAVVRLLRGSGAHVNCIPMNPVAHTPWQASGPERIRAFADRLRAAGIGVTVRRNRGQEVGAACGQLAAEQAGEPAAPTVARRRELLVAASAAALRGERSAEPAPAGLASTRRDRVAPGRRPGSPATPPERSHLAPAAPATGTMTGGGRALVAASILNADLANLANEVRRAVKAGADRIHLDVMDARFVPNLTFGWATIGALRPVTRTPFDAHLMIAEPGRWLDDFLAAGCDSITVHVEVEEPIEPLLRRIRAAGRAAGLAMRPGTPMAALEPYRDLLDIVMVMTVEPGFGGQGFMREVAAAKIPAARRLLADKPWGGEVHVDGGVNRETAEMIGGLGADVLIAGTALFARGHNPAREVRLMRALADEGFAVELNDGVPPEPRDQVVRFASLPRSLGEPLHDAIEAAGVPVVMLRGDGLVGADGVRDVDLLVPRAAAAWVEERFGARRDELAAAAAAARPPRSTPPPGGAPGDAPGSGPE